MMLLNHGVRSLVALFGMSSSVLAWKKNRDLIFSETNDTFVRMMGFKDEDHALGKTDYEIPCPFSELAEVFRSADRAVIESGKEIRFLELQQCATGEWSYLFVTKIPLIEQGEVVGVEGYAIDLTLPFSSLWDFLQTFSRTPKPSNPESYRTLKISPESPRTETELTPREEECLFFLIRGKATKETANILKISPRTVEKHIEHLKTKFKCYSKSSLIEAAIQQGFYQAVPESILHTAVSIQLT